MLYWTQKEQELITKYYWAYTATTSAQTRNYCVKELLPSLKNIVVYLLRKTGVKYNEDNYQDTIIFITCKLLPKLKAELLLGALNLILISTRNYLITYKIQPKKYIINDIDQYELCTSSNYESDYILNKEDIRVQILLELDNKITKQKILNKTNTLLLIEMKDYLINNSFDARGFAEHIQTKLQINKHTFWSIMSKIQIRSKEFNTNLLLDDDLN